MKSTSKVKSTKEKRSLKIGFIGQGWIGKNYADDFEKRGFEIVRYGLEKEYVNNKEKITDCDIVFIAVPTPTTPKGFDDSILRKAIKAVGKNKIAVIKSTILPGTTESIQKENPDIYVLHSPEFLTEATAAYDSANPTRNIMGIPIDNELYRKVANVVLDILPKAPYSIVCSAKEAEFTKYGGNCWFYFKVVFMNMLHDLSSEMNCRWHVVRDSMAADPRIGRTHLDPVHKSGRGAGGHCFIKDFEAFSRLYKEVIGDELGVSALEAIKHKNAKLLIDSGKDMDLFLGVHGKEFYEKFKKSK